ncbi:MAG TPA: Maf family nucleotide pyrophosphatase [Bacteroidia bacterium]|nr:Maf family nucleotide pyrophosphatase [Bacteroidia bacterium]
MSFFLNQFENFEIILASKSPRRHQLLNDLGIRFKIISKDVDESYPDHLQREEVALHLALKKANAFEELIQPDRTIVITADTIVCLVKQIIGKPDDYDDAVKILNNLSGKMHEVFTGVCISSKIKRALFSVRSEVYFKSLSEDEIRFYLGHYKPFDKAGAYGIQDWIGLIGIEKINGSYHNIMGLPIKEVYEHLLNFSKTLS